MYPLVHYYVNTQVFGEVSHLMALGALWPDLAVGAGGDRDEAHTQGVAFYDWCRCNFPEAMDAARGMISHGIDPPCVDHYADEFWPDHVRGYMFRTALLYLPQVAACTGLDGATDIPLLPRGVEPPRSNVWWKAHNFVEMAYEMITARQHPDLGRRLVEAATDRQAVATLARALQGWHGLPVQPILDIFASVPDSYALIDSGAQAQARVQAASMHHRFTSFRMDLPAMAELLEQISRDQADRYPIFMAFLVKRTSQQIQAFR